MQAVAFSTLLAGSILLPLRALAQQPERYAVSGDEVAIYNLAGEVQLLGGTRPRRDRRGDPGRGRCGQAQGGTGRDRWHGDAPLPLSGRPDPLRPARVGHLHPAPGAGQRHLRRRGRRPRSRAAQAQGQADHHQLAAGRTRRPRRSPDHCADWASRSRSTSASARSPSPT